MYKYRLGHTSITFCQFPNDPVARFFAKINISGQKHFFHSLNKSFNCEYDIFYY